ncbi:MAG: hypothetical protein AAF449_13795, partial [Myxococcota bacterium]
MAREILMGVPEEPAQGKDSSFPVVRFIDRPQGSDGESNLISCEEAASALDHGRDARLGQGVLNRVSFRPGRKEHHDISILDGAAHAA